MNPSEVKANRTPADTAAIRRMFERAEGEPDVDLRDLSTQLLVCMIPRLVDEIDALRAEIEQLCTLRDFLDRAERLLLIAHGLLEKEDESWATADGIPQDAADRPRD